MKKSTLFFAVLLMLPFMCMAQSQVLTLFPQENPTGLNYTSLAASGNTSFTFTFPRTSKRTSYTGVVQFYAWVDSASGTVGHRDSLTISIEPLVYDIVQGAMARSSEADHDSLDIVNLYNWGTTDADNKYDISQIADLPPCDGARVNVYAGLNAQCRVRVELRISSPLGY